MYQDSGKTAKYKEKKEKQYLINKNINLIYIIVGLLPH